MATGTAPNQPTPAQPAPTRAVPDPAAALIDDRLRRARRQVRGVELSAGLVTLALGTLAYLLVATVFDHWVIPGGFGIFGRLLLFAVLLIAGGAYCVWRIAPPLTRSVNPIFAASVLEQCRPTLKNGLVNLLFLRQEKRRRGSTSEDRLTRGVLLGLQRRTADDLARMPAETHVVDRAHIVRLAAVLAAVVIVCALYTVISPKSTMASFGRVIIPWAPIDAPTRVTIENVEPGDETVLQGQSLTVRAEVHGLRRDESVLLYYTTADGRSVDQAVPMTVAQGDYRHQCQLPPGQSGFQQDLQYYLVAGDYRTPEYAITVETSLTILVDQVTYDYPDYTGLEDETIRNVGDLRAIEGSHVTLLARANRPIDWASLEMDCNSSRRRRMSVVDSTATASFELTMTAGSPRRADYESYQIRFAESETGTQRENREPIRHRIEVIPDLPPEVRLVVEPADEMIELPLSGQLDIGVFAEDPDFALRGVTLRIEHQGRSLNVPPLLDRPRPQAAAEGAVEGSLPLRPRDFQLVPGDVLTYWAEAKDNKQPLANRSQTERRRITIVADRGGESSNPPDGAGHTSPQPPPENPEETPARPEEDLTFDNQESEEQPQQEAPEWDTPESEPEENAEEGSEEPQEGESEGGESGESGESGEGGESEASEGGESGEGGESEASEGGESEASEGGESGEGGESEASEGSESGEGGEPSTSQGRQPGQRSRPIDSTNPGEAFEEMDEYFKEQERQEAQEGQSGQPSASDEPTAGEPASEGDPSASQEPEEGEGAGSPESPDDSTSENTSPRQQPADAAEAQPNDPESGSSSDGGSDESMAPEDGEPPEGEGSASAASEDQEGGEGAGTPSEDPQPTPAAQGDNQPDEEQSPSASDQGDPSQDDSPPSPSISPEESDPEATESEPGDRPGAGDEGGGQDSDQEGQGTAGSSTPSDEGASQADESGQGETGDVPGAEAESDHPTGNPDPNQRPGPGSSQGPSQAVDPGENPQDSSDPNSADAHSNTDSQSGAESNSDSPPLDPSQVDSMGGEPGDPGSQGQPQRGSGPATGPDAQGPTDAGGPEGNAPDEDFARQTVDFVLEKLEDQLAQPEPDQELLDRLQWTREDLARFVDQWKAMKAAAGRGDYASEAAREDLDEAIKSLGLRPTGSSVFRGGLEENATPNVDARRFDPPPRWSGFRELSRGSR